MAALPTPEQNETLTAYLDRFATDDERALAVREYRTKAVGVKVLNEETGLLGGWGIPFGGPVKDKEHAAGKDLDGEYFDESTNFCFDWFPNDNRPVLYDHGTDPEVKLAVVGRQVGKFIDGKLGVWVETQLDMANQYAKYILELAKKGVLGYSSGALGGYVRRGANGKMSQWRWVEQTVTVRPANPYALIAADAVKHLEMAGLLQAPPPATLGDALKAELAVKAVWDASYIDALPDSAFAWIEAGGTKTDGKTDSAHRHLPHHSSDGAPDKTHVDNAVARFPETKGAPESALAHLEAHQKALGEDTGKEGKKLTLPDGMSLNDLRRLLEDEIEEVVAGGPGVTKEQEAYVVDVRDGFVIASVGDDWDDYYRYAFTINADGSVSVTGPGTEVTEQITWAIEPPEGKTGKAGRVMSARNMGQMHQAMKAQMDLHNSTCDMAGDCPVKDLAPSTVAEGSGQGGDSGSTSKRTTEEQETVEEILSGIKLERGRYG